MNSEQWGELLEALEACLIDADPDRALRQMLQVLTRHGLHVVEPAAEALETAWISLSDTQHPIALARPEGDVPERERLRLSRLLQSALLRVAEAREIAHIRERMEMLSSASFEGIFVHVDNSIIDANERLSELLGHTHDELLGPDTLPRCVAPEDLPPIAARVAGKVEGDYVVTAIRKDGSRFRAELHAKQGRFGRRPVRVVAVRDVTEREHRRQLLLESEQCLRELADKAFDLTVVSRDGVFVDVRGPLERVLGYTRDEVMGRSASDFATADETARVRAYVAAGAVGVFETTIIAKDGTLVPVENVAIQSTLDGQPVRLTGVRDLRPARRAAAERRKLEQLVETSQRLESLGVLAGGIAHDFNNLLVGIQGNADFLLATDLFDEQRAACDGIALSARRAASLTAQMLAYAGRREPVVREPVELSGLVAELRTLLDASLSKKARFTVDIAPGLHVLGERTTLSQVLMNLLTNASDALGKGVGTVAVRAARVRGSDPRWQESFGMPVGEGDWIEVQVEDDGEGMDAARVARVFEPFFTTKPGGHGLGLAACIGIVRAHGGAIHVASELARGSVFSVLLPESRASGRVDERSDRATYGLRAAKPSLLVVATTSRWCGACSRVC